MGRFSSHGHRIGKQKNQIKSQCHKPVHLQHLAKEQADGGDKMKCLNFTCLKSSALMCSQNWQNLLDRNKLLKNKQTRVFLSQVCPCTKHQEPSEQTPEIQLHPQLAFTNVPFFKNRSLNGASCSVLLFRWSLDIIKSSARRVQMRHSPPSLGGLKAPL